MDCPAMRQLYTLVRQRCPTSALLAIHQRACPRPEPDIGIGFPVLSSMTDVIPMLIDLKYDSLKEWEHINLIHDSSVGKS